MRLIKFFILFFLILLGVYSGILYFFGSESKTFTIEKQINYPIEKVFPQFNNLQNLTRWNHYFSDYKQMNIDYFKPYEGMGSSLSFSDKSDSKDGQMFIRYENPWKSIKYQLFEGEKHNPTTIDIRFEAINPNLTKISWFVRTQKLPFLKRSVNFWTEDQFADNINKSMVSLHKILGNIVDKKEELANIKYDTLMIENQEKTLLLGINVNTKKNDLYKSISQNYNKVYNFVTNDLNKNENEIGLPILLLNPSTVKSREISYYLGIPVKSQAPIYDNNFSYRTLNPYKTYIIYYKGKFDQRMGSIQKMIQKAKKDTLRNNDPQEIFLEAPSDEQEVNLKLVLPVFR